MKIPNLALQCAARFYIGSSSLCSRYRIPSAPLQHRHEALFADIALHEIIVCGKQEAAPVLQPRHGVEHESSSSPPGTPKKRTSTGSSPKNSAVFSYASLYSPLSLCSI